MQFQCWVSVEDAEPTLKRHWVNASVCWNARLNDERPTDELKRHVHV